MAGCLVEYLVVDWVAGKAEQRVVELVAQWVLILAVWKAWSSVVTMDFLKADEKVEPSAKR